MFGDDLEKLLERTMSTDLHCPKCRMVFSFEEGVQCAISHGIKNKVVVCPDCYTVYEADVTPQGITLSKDVTYRYIEFQNEINIQYFTVLSKKLSKGGTFTYSDGEAAEKAKVILKSGDPRGIQTVREFFQEYGDYGAFQDNLTKSFTYEPVEIKAAAYGWYFSNKWVRINDWSREFIFLVALVICLSLGAGFPYIVIGGLICLAGIALMAVSQQKVKGIFPAWARGGHTDYASWFFISVPLCFVLYFVGKILGSISPVFGVTIFLVIIYGLFRYRWGKTGADIRALFFDFDEIAKLEAKWSLPVGVPQKQDHKNGEVAKISTSQQVGAESNLPTNDDISPLVTDWLTPILKPAAISTSTDIESLVTFLADEKTRSAAARRLADMGPDVIANVVKQDWVNAVYMLIELYDESPRGEGFRTHSYSAEPVENIGWALHRLGGMDQMLEAHALFGKFRPRAARNLEMVWDHVGNWQG